ncbi:MAG: hypothetical protein M3387_13435 [Actinomycetota bacterium]|nr:hypothetical protein [Actinomycetota bacterium]
METLLGNLLLIPTTVVTVLAFGAVICRLLGVRLGLVRTVLAAILAFLVAEPLLRALLPAPAQTGAGTALLFTFWPSAARAWWPWPSWSSQR